MCRPEGRLYVRSVTSTDGAPLLHLPVAYAVALALRDAGLGTDEIAARMELPPQSMPALLELAEAKLSSLRSEPEREPE